MSSLVRTQLAMDIGGGWMVHCGSLKENGNVHFHIN
jgi:hypothetical protein